MDKFRRREFFTIARATTAFTILMNSWLGRFFNRQNAAIGSESPAPREQKPLPPLTNIQQAQLELQGYKGEILPVIIKSNELYAQINGKEILVGSYFAPQSESYSFEARDSIRIETRTSPAHEAKNLESDRNWSTERTIPLLERVLKEKPEYVSVPGTISISNDSEKNVGFFNLLSKYGYHLIAVNISQETNKNTGEQSGLCTGVLVRDDVYKQNTNFRVYIPTEGLWPQTVEEQENLRRNPSNIEEIHERINMPLYLVPIIDSVIKEEKITVASIYGNPFVDDNQSNEFIKILTEKLGRAKKAKIVLAGITNFMGVGKNGAKIQSNTWDLIWYYLKDGKEPNYEQIEALKVYFKNIGWEFKEIGPVEKIPKWTVMIISIVAWIVLRKKIDTNIVLDGVLHNMEENTIKIEKTPVEDGFHPGSSAEISLVHPLTTTQNQTKN